MIEYIDKEYTKSLFKNSDKHILEKDALCRVNSVKPANVIEIKYATEIKDKNGYVYCSNCGCDLSPTMYVINNILKLHPKFCPNCGALINK